MNRKEAEKLLQQGKKITNFGWEQGEFIRMSGGGVIIDEEGGVQVPRDIWKTDDGWEEYVEGKVEVANDEEATLSLEEAMKIMGKAPGRTSLTPEQVKQIRALSKFGYTQTDIAKKFKVSPPVINKVVARNPPYDLI